jgi:hypothetical protein
VGIKKGFRFAARKTPSVYGIKKQEERQEIALHKFIENIEIDSVKLESKLHGLITMNSKNLRS